jgi:hypothetical protein
MCLVLNWYRMIAHDLKTRNRNLATQIQKSSELLTGMIEKICTNKLYAQHYLDFVETVVYSESPTFAETIGNLGLLVDRLTA